MNDYQFEQLEALALVRMHLKALPRGEKDKLRALCAEYLEFRSRVDRFLAMYFGSVCDQTCYRSRLSACCSREGIVTFFADVVLNQLFGAEDQIDALAHVLRRENDGFKCVYLGRDGCRWKIKPIVCQMFLCEPARAKVFRQHPAAESEWADLERQRKRFTWPDRPVLFDSIEKYFLALGCSSALMYLHQSPGLLRVKRKAGI
jgi:Fe-S-cluster containining protein